jgi:hypothetical protein
MMRLTLIDGGKNEYHPSLRMDGETGPGLFHMSRAELLGYVAGVLTAAMDGELSENDFDLVIIGLLMAQHEALS